MDIEEINFKPELLSENPAESRLNADQILLHAIEQMLGLDQYDLPVYKDELLLARVSFSQIIEFLTDESKQNLLFHKLNYTLESMMTILKICSL